MIFTLFGYLTLVGIVRRDLRSAIVSLAVFVMYGGLLWALLPLRDRAVSAHTDNRGSATGSASSLFSLVRPLSFSSPFRCQMSWEGHLMGISIGSMLGAYDGRAGAIGEEEAKPTAARSVKSSDVSERTGLTAKEEEV